MADKALVLVNGIPRMQTITATAGVVQDVYEQQVDVVSGAPANGNEIQGPVTAGTDITLPSAETFTSIEQLVVLLNGGVMTDSIDFSVGTSTTTQIQMTFELVVGDRIIIKKRQPV